MTTETITELDERTKEELQPPCSATRGKTGADCENPAAWLNGLACPAGHLRERFHCDEHKLKAEMGRLRCRLCEPVIATVSILYSEPLR